MFKPIVRKYKYALIALLSYFAVISAMVGYIIWSSSHNPGDSGESAILLLIPASPWLWLLPDAWLSPLSGFICISFNGLLVALATHVAVTFFKSRDHH